MVLVGELLGNASRVKQLLALTAAALAGRALYKKFTAKPALKSEQEAQFDKKGRRKVAVDKVFFQRLRFLLKIVLPGVGSKEFLILMLHTFFLVSRTLVSIYVAQLDGSIVKSIVDRKLRLFGWLMVKWMLVAVPATYINSMIAYLENKLALAFRTRLVRHVYHMYMDTETYYRISNLDSRLSNPDQCLTEDVAQFCGDLSHLYSHLSKPCLDVILMTAQLINLSAKRGGGNSHSGVPLLLAVGVIGGTGWILKLCTPPFGKLVAEQARKYGELRAAHSRVIAASEEIAFYGGHVVEEKVLSNSYDELVKHINTIYKTRIWYTMLEQFLMRYTWGASGMLMIAWPIIMRASNGEDITKKETKEVAVVAGGDENVSTRTEEFVTSRGLLISAADAIERMMSSWKEIAELAGRTARIHEMIEIFQQVKDGHYVKQQTNIEVMEVKEEPEGVKKEGAEDAASKKDDKSVDTSPLAGADAGNSSQQAYQSQKKKLGHHTVRMAGHVQEDSDYVEAKDLLICTPSGDVLVEKLNFCVKRGMHLLITGPNGCGKSSLFRMIGSLWPVRGGFLARPSKHNMFYIPQKPYLTKSTLREQFIYPDTTKEFIEKGWTDEKLGEILEIVALKGVVAREGGLDTTNEWRDVLSGGEKQRVAMARLFYHKPHFAILDECTSAVSIDVEGQMYQAIIAQGITLLTVTHRPTLYKYHTHLLRFDGEGGYTFAPLDSNTRLSLTEEKAKLEQQLSSLPSAQKRLEELCSLLGEESIYVKKHKKHGH